MKKIVICEDDSNARSRWKKALEGLKYVKADFEVETLVSEDLNRTLSELENRRRRARNKNVKAPAWGDNLFDSADILLVDYDLLDLNKDDYLTGEGVAFI